MNNTGSCCYMSIHNYIKQYYERLCLQYLKSVMGCLTLSCTTIPSSEREVSMCLYIVRARAHTHRLNQARSKRHELSKYYVNFYVYYISNIYYYLRIYLRVSDKALSRAFLCKQTIHLRTRPRARPRTHTNVYINKYINV